MGRLRRVLARALWRMAGYRLVGDRPSADAGVLVGAPHTTNWDFVAMLAVCWQLDLKMKYLAKHTLFKGPFGVLFRATGGIPVDRSQPTAVVRDIVGRITAGERFLLVIAPEGTRTKGKYWKSGFYRIAEKAGLSITLGYLDGPTKSAGFGPTFTPTGDIRADMDVVRAFYADKHGLRPGNGTEPRLREEGALPEPG